MRQRAEWFIHNDARMVENLLKLVGGCAALVFCHIDQRWQLCSDKHT